MRDRNGERLQGLRELMRQLRQQRQERLDQFDLGGVYSEIADELERHRRRGAPRHRERHAAGRAQRRRTSRRARHATPAAERNFRLDMLPDDLAGKVRELQAYDFEIGGGRAAVRAADGPSCASS